LAGGRGDATEAARDRARQVGVNDMVLFPGYVTESELATLYRDATAFVFPSTLEGFGLPLLEAMSAGLPVIAADLPALREVAGEAALYCDPGDEGDIAQQIVRLLTDRALARSLVARGAHRLQAFTWERAAAETLSVYRRVIHQCRPPAAGRGSRVARCPGDA
jgi:glycosyltransferase involved in cell wall biosynthesis